MLLIKRVSRLYKQRRVRKRTYFIVISPIPESSAMVRKSCQNSILGSIAKPRTSECGEPEPTPGMLSGKGPSDDLDPAFLITKGEVSSRSRLWMDGADKLEACDCILLCARDCGSEVVLCVPGSSDSSSISKSMCWRSEDPVARCDGSGGTCSPEKRRDTGRYESLRGRMRRNGIDAKVKQQVPSANSKRNRPVSPLKMIVDTVDQKRALRPKAARGNAVADPR